MLDEATAIKNAASQSAKAARLLRADHRLALSGTPVENHLGELWSLFEFLNPGMLGRSRAFQRFLGAAGPSDPGKDGKLIYTHSGYNLLLDHKGYPANKPPWGTLTAIDLDSGQFAWQVPLGEYPELAARGQGGTGSQNYGGPVVTAGGLVFIAATLFDNRIRAFDKASGQVLWQYELPAAGVATPAVYEAGGRQFIVITAGGHKFGGRKSGQYLAFALPRD